MQRSRLVRCGSTIFAPRYRVDTLNRAIWLTVALLFGLCLMLLIAGTYLGTQAGRS